MATQLMPAAVAWGSAFLLESVTLLAGADGTAAGPLV